jgi:hypothetical protein
MRTGLLYGAIIAVLGAISSGVSYATGDYAAGLAGKNGTGISTALGAVVFILSIVLLIVAGRAAASATGKVGSGAVSGLSAGAIAAVVGGVISSVLIFITPITEVPASAASRLTLDQYATGLRIATVATSVVAILVYAGVGAGIGALGGLMGRGAYQKAHAAAMPMGYPQQPMQ